MWNSMKLAGPGPARFAFGALYPQITPLIQPQQGWNPSSVAGSAMSPLPGIGGALGTAFGDIVNAIPGGYQQPQTQYQSNGLGSLGAPQPRQTWNPYTGIGPAMSDFGGWGAGNYPYAGFGNNAAPYSWGQNMSGNTGFGGDSPYSPSSFGAY